MATLFVSLYELQFVSSALPHVGPLDTMPRSRHGNNVANPSRGTTIVGIKHGTAIVICVDYSKIVNLH